MRDVATDVWLVGTYVTTDVWIVGIDVSTDWNILGHLPTYIRMSPLPKMSLPSDLAGLSRTILSHWL